MLITVNEAKEYLRIESSYTDEDNQITALITAAESFLKNAGCVLNASDELAKLAVKLLVVHWYEHREIIGKAEKLAFSLDTMKMQLQYATIPEGGALP